MTKQDIKYYAAHLQIAGCKAMPGVLQMLRDSNLSDMCYAYKIRTKPEAKLIEKVNRKKTDKPDYALENITDVVGLRLVALFRAEMADIFEGILQVITHTHTNGIQPNPFIKGHPEEVIIYKGTNAFDDLAPRLKDIAHRLCPELPVNEVNSREGYSSVHLVTRLSALSEAPPCDSYKIPIEIQIRSVFEDAWGEIDHKYGYVIRNGKDSGKPISNPEFVMSHLKVLKRFSDACMEYADAIRTEAVGVPLALINTRKVHSVASDDYILERFRALAVSDDIISNYREARALKDKAASLMDKNRAEGKKSYINAAELFRELENLLPEEASLGRSLVYYYSRMNEALCLMSTNEKDQVIAAYGIYQTLEADYADYSLLKMRHGQALGKLGYIDPAIELLRTAGEQARNIASAYEGRKIADWPDFLPYADYEHITQNQPKLLGYNIWLKIRSLTPQEGEQKARLFMDAYNVTNLGLGVVNSKQQTLSLHNNLLYYALGVLTRVGLIEQNEKVNHDSLQKKVLAHLEYIEKDTSFPKDISIPAVDTIMKAYSILGRQTDAAKMASLLIEKCLNEPNIEIEAEEKLELIGLAHSVAKGKIVNTVN